jgi:pimeloyl-ACP methyl ester carboxylesterase
MTVSRRRGLVGAFFALALAAGLTLGARGARLRRGDLLRFRYNLLPFDPGAYTRLAGHPGWRAAGLRGDDGVALRGLFRPPDSPGGAIVLFFPGNEGHPLEEGQRFLDALRGDHGWGSSVWAYRGFDGSDGRPTPEALARDGLDEYQWLLAQGGDGARIHVVGFSLGTSIASYVAASAAGTPSGARRRAPASLTLLAPLTEIELTTGSWALPQRYETLSSLGAIACPVLVIHGAADHVLPIADGRAVAARLGERARFVEETGVGHLDLPENAAALGEVRSFLAQRATDTGGSPARP